MKKLRFNEIDFSISESHSILAALLFNESSGNIVFDYARGFGDGDIDGASWEPDIIGSVLDFSGSSKVIIESDEVILPVDNFSLLTRIKFNGNGSVETVWAAYDGATDLHSHLYRDASKIIHIALGDGASVVDIPFNTAVDSGEWVDIGIAWDAESTVIKGYINGIEDVSSTANINLVSSLTEDILIGQKPGMVPEQFDGRISFLYIWDKSVTETEFRRLNTYPYLIFKNDTLINVLLSKSTSIYISHTIHKGVGEGVGVGVG